MTRFLMSLCLVSAVAACGGGGRQSTSVSGTAQSFSTGPIGSACLIANRKSASRGLCGCVQAAADISLSPADQRRGAIYFADPATLQEVRQSDVASNERFWDRWKQFGELAESMCTSV